MSLSSSAVKLGLSLSALFVAAVFAVFGAVVPSASADDSNPPPATTTTATPDGNPWHG